MKEGINSGRTVKVDRGGGLSHLLQVKPLEVGASQSPSFGSDTKII